MWSKTQQTEAQMQGWGVFDVWTGNVMLPMILPIQFNSKMPHARAMLAVVIANARARDPLCTAALQHVSLAQRKP